MCYDDSVSVNKRVTNKEDEFTQKDLVIYFYIFFSVHNYDVYYFRSFSAPFAFLLPVVLVLVVRDNKPKLNSISLNISSLAKPLSVGLPCSV